MGSRELIMLVGLIAVCSSWGFAADEVIPNTVVRDLEQVAFGETRIGWLDDFSARLSKTSVSEARVELDPKRGLNVRTRDALGHFATSVVRAIGPDLLQTTDSQSWRTEYSEQLGIELISIDLSKTESDNKSKMTLRLWVARDLATAANVLWVRRGSLPLLRPIPKEGTLQDVASDSRYVFSRASNFSLGLEENDPRLIPDRISFITGNVVVELEGLSFYKFDDREGWITSGLSVDERLQRILEEIRFGLGTPEGLPQSDSCGRARAAGLQGEGLFPEGFLTPFSFHIREKEVVNALRGLREQLSGTSRVALDLDLDTGMSQETIAELGRLAFDGLRTIENDFQLIEEKRPWRRAFSNEEEAGALLVVAVDVFDKDQESRVDVRLRLWIVQDLSAMARLLWVRRNGDLWQSPVQEGVASPGGSLLSAHQYRVLGRAHSDSPVERGDPELRPDRFGLPVGNVLVEVEGNSFFPCVGKEGWCTTGFDEEELAWQILSEVRRRLEALELPAAASRTE